jgi:DNA polymerase-1
MKETKKTVTCDVEADDLLPGVKNLWCVVCEEHETGTIRTFVRDDFFKKFEEVYSLGEENSFKVTQHKLSSFPEYAETVDTFVGQNFLGYDAEVLRRFTGVDIPVEKITDTLIMSRLYNTNDMKRPFKSFNDRGKVLSTFFRQKRIKHTLDSWGQTLEFPKFKFDKFDTFSLEMLLYCIQDVRLNTAVHRQLRLEGRDFSALSLEIETKAQYLLNLQEKDGFYIDLMKAQMLLADLEEHRDKMLAQLQADFPPVKKLVKTFTPKFKNDVVTFTLRYKKNGEMIKVDKDRLANPNCKKNEDGTYTLVKDNRMYKHDEVLINKPTCEDNGDGTYSYYTLTEFNPRSSDQIIERMNAVGWRPVKFGKLTAKMKEHNRLVKNGDIEGEIIKPKPLTGKDGLENYDTLPDDAPQSAKNIATYKLLEHRITTVNGWFDAMGDSGRVHGRTINIGAWSQRCSHKAPNMANLPKPKFFGEDHKPILGLDGKFTYEMRDCFTISNRATRRIVGVDAEGIQLRALAHYMEDDEYIEAILNGKKEDKTDIHNLNLKKTRGILTTRDQAKTFIYAFLLGGGNYKLGVIADAPVGKEASVGSELREIFLEEIPALEELIAKTVEAADKGYMVGLDGRHVPIPSAHHALTAYLQSFEAIVMKYAMIIKDEWFRKENLDVKQVAFVHDEWQHDSHIDCAERVGELACQAITEVGERLNSNIRLDGSCDIGYTWAESH